MSWGITRSFETSLPSYTPLRIRCTRTPPRTRVHALEHTRQSQKGFHDISTPLAQKWLPPIIIGLLSCYPSLPGFLWLSYFLTLNDFQFHAKIRSQVRVVKACVAKVTENDSHQTWERKKGVFRLFKVSLPKREKEEVSNSEIHNKKSVDRKKKKSKTK